LGRETFPNRPEKLLTEKIGREGVKKALGRRSEASRSKKWRKKPVDPSGSEHKGRGEGRGRRAL